MHFNSLLGVGLVLLAPAGASQLPPLFVVDGGVPWQRLGIAVDGVGDVNGDGVDDYVIGASEGSSPAGTLGRVSVHSGVDGALLHVFPEEIQGQAFGAAVAGAGDVNGDGFADIIVGARYDNTMGTFAGSASVFSGLDGSLLHNFFGDDPEDRLGAAVAGAGDVDGDGFDDVIVGSIFDNTVAFWAGSARVFSGFTGETLHEFLGDSSFHLFGSSVAGAGDVNGDGTPDLIVGTQEDDTNGGNAGMARVFSGKDGSILFTFLGDSAGDSLGLSVNGAGDVNGDGHADLIVGAPLADAAAPDGGMARVLSGLDGSVLLEFHGSGDGHHLGSFVSGLGDSDGDGLADLLVGAEFDDGGTGLAVGSARIYSGADGSVLKTVVGSQPGGRLGFAVAGAGDVDGDGLADLIVGAPYHDAAGWDTGRAEVYSGIGNIGVPYCGPAVSNSTGAPAALVAFGSRVAAAGRLRLVADSLPPERFAYFLTSAAAGFVAGPGGSQGNLCLSGPIGRFVQDVANSGPLGRLVLEVDISALPLNPPHGVAPGETWRFQAWFRDVNPGPTSNFTDGVAVSFR
jgi:FG-GAP repeat